VLAERRERGVKRHIMEKKVIHARTNVEMKMESTLDQDRKLAVQVIC
jgi:hypothetical protein